MSDTECSLYLELFSRCYCILHLWICVIYFFRSKSQVEEHIQGLG